MAVDDYRAWRAIYAAPGVVKDALLHLDQWMLCAEGSGLASVRGVLTGQR